MTKVLVLYYSSYGHIEQMAYAVAEGAREVEGVEAVVKRVPELVSEEVARQSHFKLDQPAPVATPAELADYDAIIVGTPTRFGNMTAQMRNFWDQTGGLWMSGRAGRQGRQRVRLQRHPARRQRDHDHHHDPDPAAPGPDRRGPALCLPAQMGLEEIKGGSPYGATTIAGGQGERQPSEQEKGMARFQGQHVTEIAKKLKG